MTDKKDHGDMDRFIWTAEHIKVHKKNIPKKSEPDQDPQPEKDPTAPKGG